MEGTRRRAAHHLLATREQGGRRNNRLENENSRNEARESTGEVVATVPVRLPPPPHLPTKTAASYVTHVVATGPGRLPTPLHLPTMTAARYVTNDWFGMYDVISTSHAEQQLTILGHSGVPVDRLKKTVETMFADREAVKNHAKSIITGRMVGAAQIGNVHLFGRQVHKIKDIASWWSSLPKKDVPMYGETMFQIQQGPFERDDWLDEAEEQFLEAQNMNIFEPPMSPYAQSCFWKAISQMKVDITKRLSGKAKQKGGHGYYISIKHADGERKEEDNTVRRTARKKRVKRKRRKKGTYHPSMLVNIADRRKKPPPQRDDGIGQPKRTGVSN